MNCYRTMCPYRIQDHDDGPDRCQGADGCPITVRIPKRRRHRTLRAVETVSLFECEVIADEPADLFGVSHG